MKAGEAGWLRRFGRSGLWLCLLAGCATGRGHSDAAVQASRVNSVPRAEMNENYQVSCPDSLEVTIVGRKPVQLKVGVDGRLDLEGVGRPRVEGLTPGQIAERIATLVGVPPMTVQVRVVGYESQQVFIFGEVNGLQRAVPYRGQETVLELLQRAGGLTTGAETNDLYVVRSHIADGGQPEVYPIQLTAGNKGTAAQLKLQPFDQVYIGETRQSGVCRSLPPCLRPLYESLWGMKRHEDKRTQ